MQTRGILMLIAVVAALATVSLLAAPAPAADPFVIGGIFSATGPHSYLGDPEKKTMEMLAAAINAKGGIKGTPVKVIIEDDEGDSTKARLHAEKLVHKDKVLAVIGPSLTPTSMTALEVTQKAKVPMISCAAAAEITAPADQRQYVFKTAQTDQMAVGRILTYLKKKNLTKVAIITVTSSFGEAGKKQLLAQTQPAGIEIVAQESFGDKDTDMTPQLTNIKGKNPQVVICWGTGPAPALVAKNMKQLGMTMPLVQSHGAASQKFIELAGDAADGILLPAGKLVIYKLLPDSDPQKAVCKKYDEEFQAKYNKPASSFGGYAYDAMGMLVIALEKAGADRDKIREAVEQTKGYVGVSGVFNMSPQDHNGLTPDAFVIVKIEKGAFVLAD